MLHDEKTKLIIRCFYNVYNALGYGFLEKVYENALMLELIDSGFNVKRQNAISVYYKGQMVGEYYSDLIVDDLILVELKSVETLAGAHRNQTINYLKASKLEVGLLMNFGETPTFERFLFTNDKKPLLKNQLKSV
jgi:GxxExxY protein